MLSRHSPHDDTSSDEEPWPSRSEPDESDDEDGVLSLGPDSRGHNTVVENFARLEEVNSPIRGAPGSGVATSGSPSSAALASNPYRMHPASPVTTRGAVVGAARQQSKVVQNGSHPPRLTGGQCLPMPATSASVTSPHRSARIVSPGQPIEVPDSDSECDTDTESEKGGVTLSSKPRVPTSKVPSRIENKGHSAEQQTLSAGLIRASTMPAIGSSRAFDHAQPDIPPSPSTPSPMNRSQSDNYSSSQPVSMSSAGNDNSTPTGRPLILSKDGYVIISHDGSIQDQMDRLEIPWGAQYELARGVSKGWWQWSEVTEQKLKKLTSRTGNGPLSVTSPARVVDVMFDRAPVPRRTELWRELDREQSALVENNTRGLGLMGAWKESTQPNWYGGKIQQIVRLVPHKVSEKKDAPAIFYLQLEPMQMGRSHRFARHFGSCRILQMKLPKLWGMDRSQLKKLFTQKFVLCGRVFVAFAVKDSKLYLVEIDEDYEHKSRSALGDHLRMSLEALIDWYNPMQLNGKQKVNKWTARFDLGLSTSIPVLQFDPRNIFIIDDICAPHPSGESVPAHKIYTDGCGFMNKTALITIGRALNFTERPTAVQGRILGSKGVWTLHPEHSSLDEPPMIWIRKSQQKIHLVDPKEFNAKTLSRLHRAHFIFDLLAPSRVSIPSRLSRSTIINLEFNGVPKDVFIKLMEDGLTNEVESLTQWTGPGAMLLLWDAVNKNSAVTTQRLQRTAAGFQRALGLTNKRDNDGDEEEDDTIALQEAEAIVSCEADLSPYSIGEGIMERLQAGFSPLQDRPLYEDLKRLVEETMKRYIQEYHIVIPQSAEAFIIPDPTGKLKAGEIHFKSTQYLKDPLENFNPNTIIGDVLIFRNPARVASDVQKVKAVTIPELADYVDVIVVPIQGAESLPSLLAGGDVDGDTAVCIYDETLVTPFRQPVTVREPEGLMDNFEPLDKVPTVTKVLEAMQSDPAKSTSILHEHLLIGMAESRTGLYSKFHDNAVYSLGYNHPVTIRNAFMFTTILDSRKSGLVLRNDVFLADKKEKYAQTSPVCLGGPDSRSDNIVRIKRTLKHQFILEELLHEGKLIQNKLLAEYQSLWTGPRDYSKPTDIDLQQPWLDARKIDFLRPELDRLQTHVDKCIDTWKKIFGPRLQGYEKKGAVEAKRKLETNKKLELARNFARGPEGCDTLRSLGRLDAIRASYTYTVHPRFAWAMAFQGLCSIKASAKGAKAFNAEFADMVSMPAAARRVLAQDVLAIE